MCYTGQDRRVTERSPNEKHAKMQNELGKLIRRTCRLMSGTDDEDAVPPRQVRPHVDGRARKGLASEEGRRFPLPVADFGQEQPAGREAAWSLLQEAADDAQPVARSEEHTSELQSLAY